ncbi:UNVERIFIED_CONTAM: hypothetical protein K2H54_011085 [Gekko kuhli]
MAAHRGDGGHSRLGPMAHPGRLLQLSSSLPHVDTVELTQEERMDSKDDDETMVEEEPEPDMPPGAILAQLFPNSHMAIIRSRRQQVSALQRVGECLLEQSGWNHEAMLANAQREHENYLE